MALSVYNAAAYYFCLALFAAGGLVVNAGCLLLEWLPRTPRTERAFQRLVHRLFILLAWLLRRLRMVEVRIDGTIGPAAGGRVVAANHPGLLDAPLLLAHLPSAVCIFKPAIRRNPLLGAAARKAGYLANDGGVDLLRAAADKVARGATLLIFPEGTRTPPGAQLGGLRAGFVLIARRAEVPVQLVRITYSADVLTKARPWWRVPSLPLRVRIEAGPLLAPDDARPGAALTAAAAAWYQSRGDSVPPPMRESLATAASTVLS